jgi:hypothetical protein
MTTTKKIVHVLDIAATVAYAEREPITVASVELVKTGTQMIVPILKDDELIGGSKPTKRMRRHSAAQPRTSPSG